MRFFLERANSNVFVVFFSFMYLLNFFVFVLPTRAMSRI